MMSRKIFIWIKRVLILEIYHFENLNKYVCMTMSM